MATPTVNPDYPKVEFLHYARIWGGPEDGVEPPHAHVVLLKERVTRNHASTINSFKRLTFSAHVIQGMASERVCRPSA
jgi:hypothetical protein